MAGNWTYNWNNENRLASATDGSRTIHFTYDYQGRLVKKDDGRAIEVYVYDGWNRIATFDSQVSTLSLQVSYLWGLDLSGSLQGAGGVGGLLKEGSLYPTYDANGYIMQKLDGNGVTVMNVAYDPFGNIISGTLVGEYGFSTKPFVEGPDWYYYGFRYYDASTGRWPSRDPIAETGGLNLYIFVKNDGLNYVDVLGEQGCDPVTGRGCRNRPSRNPSNLSFQFSVGTSLSVGGCFNAGPFIICVTGGYSISKGKCCDSSSGEEKDVVELSGSISASTGVGISTGFTYSFDPIGQLGTVGDCPSGSLNSIWDAISGSFDVDAQLGPLAGGCSWSGPTSGWSCSAGLDFSLGASVTVGGTLTVSGQFLDE